MNNENAPASVIFIDAIDGYNNGFDVEELKSILRGFGCVLTSFALIFADCRKFIFYLRYKVCILYPNVRPFCIITG